MIVAVSRWGFRTLLGRTGFVGALGLAAAAGCYVGPVADGVGPKAGAGGSSGSAGSSGTTDGGGGGGRATSGLPCDVDAILEKSCRSCHGVSLSAPMALLSYDDLVKAPPSGKAARVVDAMVARMADSASPMPPSGVSPAADVDVIRTWIADGLPRGTCGAPPPGTEGGSSGSGGPQPTVCTSGMTWSRGRKGVDMQPGRACISCHQTQSDEGPIVAIGGTVYPTVHEPDGCFGANGSMSGAEVVIVDATGKTISLPVGPSGNFALLEGADSFTTPIKVKVVAGGKVRAMSKSPPSGDCNSCHTEQGLNGAPGRIFLP